MEYICKYGEVFFVNELLLSNTFEVKHQLIQRFILHSCKYLPPVSRASTVQTRTSAERPIIETLILTAFKTLTWKIKQMHYMK